MKKKLSIVLVAVTLILTFTTTACANELVYIKPPVETGYHSCKIISHRGLSAVAPENTVAAFDLAGQKGSDGIEFDIYPTTDGRWVVMHDETVDRMTNKEGKITEMTFAQTQQCVIDAGNGINNNKGQKIPTLEQVLEICEKYHTTPYIEIKGGNENEIQQLAKLLSGYKNHNDFVVISFIEDYLVQLKSVFPNMKMYWLVSSAKEENISYCIENHLDGIDFNYKKTSNKMIEEIVASGLTAAAWTVDSVKDFESLCAAGVGVITSNCIVGSENTCSHICHSNNSFLKIIWKIVKSIRDIFGNKDEYCTCYVKH